MIKILPLARKPSQINPNRPRRTKVSYVALGAGVTFAGKAETQRIFYSKDIEDPYLGSAYSDETPYEELPAATGKF